MGGLLNAIAAGPQSPQILTPQQVQAGNLAIQQKQQEIQQGRLTFEQQRQAMQDQFALRKAYLDSGGDIQKFLQTAPAYGVSPQAVMSIREADAKTREQLATTDKATLETTQKKHSDLAERAAALARSPNPAANYALFRQRVIEDHDIPADQIPEQFDPQWVQHNAASALTSQQYAEQELQRRAADTAAKQAETAATKEQREGQTAEAELPGLKAKSDMAVQQAAALKAMTPESWDQQVDAVVKDPRANQIVKGIVHGAVSLGHFDTALSAIKEAGQSQIQQAAELAKETNPALINARVGQAVATQRALNGTAATANVPPHLVPVAAADYNKSAQSLSTAQAAADDVQKVLDLALAGNKAAGANVPLIGVGAANAVNGIKRINSAEIRQYGTAGSLLDNIQGKLQGWTEGQPIPADVLQDMKAFHSTIAQGALKKHSQEVQIINKTYGSSFEPMKFAPSKEAESTPSGTPKATHRYNPKTGQIEAIP